MISEGEHRLDLREGVDVGRFGQSVEQEASPRVGVKSRGGDLIFDFRGHGFRPPQLEGATEFEMVSERHPIRRPFGRAEHVRRQSFFSNHRHNLGFGQRSAGFVTDEE